MVVWALISIVFVETHPSTREHTSVLDSMSVLRRGKCNSKGRRTALPTSPRWYFRSVVGGVSNVSSGLQSERWEGETRVVPRVGIARGILEVVINCSVTIS